MTALFALLTLYKAASSDFALVATNGGDGHRSYTEEIEAANARDVLGEPRS